MRLEHNTRGQDARDKRRAKQMADLGYEGKRLHSGTIADEFAPWVGTCPADHKHYRYRKPTRVLACGLCSRKFSAANRIDWVHRTVSRPRG